MIQYYKKSPFGVGLLLRVNGSAVYRSVVPGMASAMFAVFIRVFWHPDGPGDDEERELHHPYALGVLISTLTFLLIFRVQQGYARYWEACTAIHQMMSKFMDATMHAAAFHMQCNHYDRIKPPVFFDYPELNQDFLTRARERTNVEKGNWVPEAERLHHRAVNKSIENVHSMRQAKKRSKRVKKLKSSTVGMGGIDASESTNMDDDPFIPTSLTGKPTPDGNWGKLFDDGKATFYDPKKPDKRPITGFASRQGGRTPPLFLQELAHLTSLLNGVALSTLRNDIEGAESPLDIYEPGSPWPEVDPDKIHSAPITFSDKLNLFLGIGRSAQNRTMYNASRPLPVLGGVSNGEIRYLQMARGPYAKTTLCSHWLTEFMMREHLAGTLGAIGPPIISRINQFMSDGMTGYSQARKIMFIPFPFPHAQLSVSYVLISIPAIALLMDQYIHDLWLLCLVSFLVVTCLSGIHEVARELENPFRNVPNELPLVTLQAQFNEALLVMFAGYHPDFFWKEEADILNEARNNASCCTLGSIDETKALSKDEMEQALNGSTALDADLTETTDNRESATEYTPSVKELMQLIMQQQNDLRKQSDKIDELQGMLNTKKDV